VTTDQSIVDRVRKLFALASDNSNENESHAALEMARKLMKQHNIAQIDVEAGEENVNVDINLWKSESLSQIDTYSRYLATAAATLFDCQHWLMRGGAWNKYRVVMHFAGEATDVALASEVWPWLVKQAKMYAQNLFGKGWTPRHRSFAEAFGTRIYNRVLEMIEREKKCDNEVDQKYALVVAGKESAVKQYMDNLGIQIKLRNLSARGKQYSDAIVAGLNAADKVNLNFRSQVGNGKTEQKALR